MDGVLAISILTAFFALVVGGILLWTYKLNISDCQEEYDSLLLKNENVIKEAWEKPDYFMAMSTCISNVCNWRTDFSKKYSKKVLEKTDMHENRIVIMYEKLVSVIENEYIKLKFKGSSRVDINAWISVLNNMQNASECISEMESTNLVAITEEHQKKVQEAFKALGEKLNREYSQILYEINSVDNYGRGAKELKNLIDKYDKFVGRFRTGAGDLKEIDDWVDYLKMICFDFEKIEQNLKNEPVFYLHNTDYGKYDEIFYSRVMEITEEEVKSLLHRSYIEPSGNNIFDYFMIKRQEFAECLWHVAISKPFVAERFKAVSDAFLRYNKNTNICMDVFLAELYYRKQMGADQEVENRVRNFLRGEYEKNIYSLSGITLDKRQHSELMTGLASGLMWMGAYSSEKLVLEHMLSIDLPMSPKVQERLHSLNSGGAVASKSYAFSSDSERIYFDVSPVSWNDDRYESFLGNLEFEEKLLTYSLGVRSDEKEIPLTKLINTPSDDDVFAKMKEIFSDEYGEEVKIEKCKCSILSGNSQEEIDAILLQSQQCMQLGIVVYMITIGKKMYVKFYTLYMPCATNMAEQRQWMMSLYKKMSPNVTMWESSIKDTVLIGLEQLLNDTKSNHSIIIENDEKEY